MGLEENQLATAWFSNLLECCFELSLGESLPRHL